MHIIVNGHVRTSKVISMDNALLTHRGQDKMAAIFQTTFTNSFSGIKYEDEAFSEVCFQGLNQQFSSIGSENGLALARWQAIIWTNDG